MSQSNANWGAAVASYSPFTKSTRVAPGVRPP